MTSDSYVARLLAEPEISPARRLSPQTVVQRRVFLRILPLLECLLDLLTCAAVIAVIDMLQRHIGGPVAHPRQQMLVWSVVAGLFTIALLQRRAADTWTRLHPIHETAAAVRTCFGLLALLLVASFAMPAGLRIGSIVVGIVLLPPVLALQKRLCFAILHQLYGRGLASERVVICGGGEEARCVAHVLRSSPRLALRPIAVIDTGGCISKGYETGLATGAASAELLKVGPWDVLMIVGSALAPEQRESLSALARQVGASLVQITGGCPKEDASAEEIAIRSLLRRYQVGTEAKPYYESSKRLIDVVVSSFLLLVLSPVFLVVTLLIRIGSQGPAFFVQQRVGESGALFRMYKFRTMSTRAARHSASPKSSGDPRITTVGRILRRTSLDELPQLLNVLLGQMSLVGPRPEMPFIVRRYKARQRQRLQVAPGITGLWQLSQDRSSPIHENLHHDLAYIRHRTLSIDVAILIHTLFFALQGGV